MVNRTAFFFFVHFIFLFFVTNIFAQDLKLSQQELKLISEKIYKNECGGEDNNLTCWNKGENFASLGIGHFIWYPVGEKKVFDESFPELLNFLKENNFAIPQWLEKDNAGCPWKTRNEFYDEFYKTKMRSLRIMLKKSFLLQMQFIAMRMQNALPSMLKTVSSKKLKQHIIAQFYRVAYSSMGMYALIDYINFKGEGVLPSERYKGQGWGLLQVLENMNRESVGPETIDEFIDSAKGVLAQRVKNSPKGRNEQKWLQGWYNRLETYKNSH